jgi:hypothetical protein
MPGLFPFQGYYDRMANAGITPPDFETPVGQVRLLTSDTDSVPSDPVVAGQGDYLWSSDAEIQALIDLTGSPQRAAIRILRLVAMTPAMQYKKWSSADLSVDGAAITRALRELINDIEKSIDGEAETAASEYSNMVDTGTVMGQPALHRSATYRGQDLDTTLPIGTDYLGDIALGLY